MLLHDRSYLSHSESEQHNHHVIQGPDQELAGTHQRLRDSMSGRAEVWFRSPTKQQNICPAEIKNRARPQAARLMNIITVNPF